MGCCQGGSRRCAVKVASSSRQRKQTDFCMFCSTYVHSCWISWKDSGRTLVGLCPRVAGVGFGSQSVVGGTRGEEMLLQ